MQQNKHSKVDRLEAVGVFALHQCPQILENHGPLFPQQCVVHDRGKLLTHHSGHGDVARWEWVVLVCLRLHA